MRAWQLQNTGKQNLKMIEVDRPIPGPGDVLVRTRAVSLNFRDKAIIDGTYPIALQMPLVLASDLAGEVVAVGDRVDQVKVGDSVLSVFKPLWIDGVPSQEAGRQTLGGPLPGVLAEYVVLSQHGVLRYPPYLSPAEAASLPIAAVTAWSALFKTGDLKSGQTILVQGSGGVALAALQLASAHGARTIALTRGTSKIARLKELGALDVIDTTATPDWQQEVLRLTGGNGVDQVVDVLGGDSLRRSTEATAWGGQVSVIGFMDQPTATISVGTVLGRGIRIQGIGVGSRRDTQDLLTFLESHRLRPVIESTYPFAEAPAAFEHLDRGPFGKVVILVED
ncbi:NAD(P)-dependent alcohol dehydrogenase [Granulicella cerasi]|uniref:NAD(P)-dependent alcohol dehydrogenase n=1 Tax=Granulicella cerasi TaxID=741063 RepID=A0ABW1Z8Y2_9BACT|nr:NAD(P)-dependent alcohol dehydrogenase [Granulicella cerasi]